jgi:aspartate racemase
MEFRNQAAHNRLIGILGGMGPEATLDLYRYILKLTPAHKDQDHIRVLIYSNPKIPDRTKAIAQGGQSPLPYLIESASLLEKSGADIILIPCNTSHHFLPQIQEQIHVPIMNMIEEACKTLTTSLPDVKTVGLLATIGTVRSGIYSKVLSRVGVNVVLPSDGEQKTVQAAIAQVKAGVHNRSTQDTFESIAKRLVKSGADAIILGCTEIPLAFDPYDVDCPSINPTKILAQAAVDWALGKRKE